MLRKICLGLALCSTVACGDASITSPRIGSSGVGAPASYRQMGGVLRREPGTESNWALELGSMGLIPLAGNVSLFEVLEGEDVVVGGTMVGRVLHVESCYRAGDADDTKKTERASKKGRRQ